MKSSEELASYKRSEKTIRKGVALTSMLMATFVGAHIFIDSKTQLGMLSGERLGGLWSMLSQGIGLLLLWKGKIEISTAGWIHSIDILLYTGLNAIINDHFYIIAIYTMITHASRMALTHGEKIINLFILQFITLIFLIFIIRSFLLTEVDGMICLSAEKLQLEGKTVIFPLIFTQILWILDIICSYKKERLLKKLNEDMCWQSEEKEKFFASMSHEMRNPLNSLLGAIDLLINQQGNPNLITNPKILSSAKFSGEILHTLIDNILDFSKIRMGKMDLNFSGIDLREKLLKVINMFEQQARKKGIRLEYHPDETLPPVLQMDCLKINQIIINLIGNAIKFTNTGRVVLKTSWYQFSKLELRQQNYIKEKINELRAQSSREDIYFNVDEQSNKNMLNISPLKNPAIIKTFGLCNEEAKKDRSFPIISRNIKSSPSLFQPKSDPIYQEEEKKREEVPREDIAETWEENKEGIVKIEVIDTGFGISEEKQLTLFQAFSQGDKEISNKYGGTGLGLWVSRGLSLLMGGDIFIESELETGCNFMVILPVTVPKEQRISQGFDSGELKLSGNIWERSKNKYKMMKCLYVDDIQENHTYMNEISVHLGINVSFAEDGLEGMSKYIRQPRIDLILTDLRMPKMSGQEMITEIRKFEQEQALREVKIMIVTGEPSENERKICLELLRADSFLQKPIQFEDLLKELDKLFSKSAPIKRRSSMKNIHLNSRRNILILDDDTMCSSIVKEFLVPFGYTILQSFTIQNAYEMFVKNHETIELVIVDSLLPDGSGRDAINKFKKFEKTNLLVPPKIFSISGNSIKLQKRLYKNMNIEKFFVKPFSREELVNAVKLCLN